MKCALCRGTKKVRGMGGMTAVCGRCKTEEVCDVAEALTEELEVKTTEVRTRKPRSDKGIKKKAAKE